MYRYAEVEAALFRVHELPEAMRPAFNARLKYLQRLGLTKAKPGKGTRIEYDFEDVCLWAFCLELAQFGMDPTRIASLKDVARLKVVPAMLARTEREDMFFAAYPSVLSAVALGEVNESMARWHGLVGIDLNPMAWVYPGSELLKLVEERALLINLTRLHARLVAALATP